MAIKRKDIREIIGNEALDAESKEKALLDLFHHEADELRDANDKLSADLASAVKERDAALQGKEKAEGDLESFKADQISKQARATKEGAYRQLLEEAGVADKRIASILKVTDIDSIEVDKNGAVKNADKLKADIAEEWAEFIPATSTKGADVSQPPKNTGAKMSKAEIMKIKDTTERQQAIIDNHELFGI